MEAIRRELGPAPRFARLTVSPMLGKSDIGTEGEKAIIEQAHKLARAVDQPVSLIVIDTLARAMAGDDENAAADMTAFISRCNAISEATGAAVIVVHHTGKDTDKGMRGSSTLFAACDCVGMVEHKKGEKGRAIRFEKVKDGEIGEAAPFVLKQVMLGTDEDGDPITSCIVDIDGAASLDTRQRPSPVQLNVLNNFDQIILEDRYEVTIEREGIPGGVKAVQLEDLIERCRKSGVTSSEKNARAVVKKEIQKLQDKNWIRQFDGLVWRLRR